MAVFAGLIAVWSILSVFWPDTVGSFQAWNTVAEPDDFRTMAVTFVSLCIASLIPQSQGLYAIEVGTGVVAFGLLIAVIYARAVDGPTGYELAATVVMFVTIGLVIFAAVLRR